MNPIEKEFRFLVLNTKADWQRVIDNQREEEGKKTLVATDRGLQLNPISQFELENTIELPDEDKLNEKEEVDLAVGDCGQLYLLDTETKQIWLYDSLSQNLERVKQLEEFSRPTEIAFSQRAVFVAGESEVVVEGEAASEGEAADEVEVETESIAATTRTLIYAFGRFSWKTRWSVDLQQDNGLGASKVVDLAADDEGNLYVLLKGEPEPIDTVIAKYDSSGNRIQAAAFARDNIGNPVAIALDDPKDPQYVFVLDAQENQERVVQFNKVSGEIEKEDFINFGELRNKGLVPQEIQPAGLAVSRERESDVGDDRATARNDGQFIFHVYFGDGRATVEDNDRFIFHVVVLPSREDPEVELLPGYRDAVTKLSIDRTGRLFVFNAHGKKSGARGETKVVKVFKKTERFVGQNAPGLRELPSATLVYKFDSAKPGTSWHKLVLQRESPQEENTQIKVRYFATDNKLQKAGEWSAPLINPRDALIRGATGRYLHLEITLIGNEENTPTLKSVRVYFPRLSYLRYLPAVYQEDEASRDFLERFLSLFETFFTDTEEKIEHIVRYFDVDATPSDFLPWLARWLALAADDNWTEAQLRELIGQAPDLYRKRGTRAGIEKIIEIFTGDRPLIMEYFQPEQWKESMEKSGSIPKELEDWLDYLTQAYTNHPFRFWVLLKPFSVRNEKEWQTIQRVIEADKPAYTEACIKVLQPWIYLGRECYLGFNTHLLGASGTVLTDIEEAESIDPRSQLEIGTTLS